MVGWTLSIPVYAVMFPIIYLTRGDVAATLDTIDETVDALFPPEIGSNDG